jgi:exosome complex exonuclease RRP6
MTSPTIPDPVKDFQNFQSSLFKSLMAATAAANSIPVEEVGFFRSLDRQFAKDLDHAGSSSLAIGNSLLQLCADDCGIKINAFEDIDDVVGSYGKATDVCDGLLEKAVRQFFFFFFFFLVQPLLYANCVYRISVWIKFVVKQVTTI